MRRVWGFRVAARVVTTALFSVHSESVFVITGWFSSWVLDVTSSPYMLLLKTSSTGNVLYDAMQQYLEPVIRQILQRNRGWLAAAGLAALVLIAGAILLGVAAIKKREERAAAAADQDRARGQKLRTRDRARMRNEQP